MAAPPICSGTPGTQAFAAQPKAPPALAIQGKCVGVRNAVKIQLEKNFTGPWSFDGLLFSLYFALAMHLQFFVLFVSGSSSVITSLESFMDFFFLAVFGLSVTS